MIKQKKKQNKTIKVGDKVGFGELKGTVTGVLLRGKGFREYECIFSDSNSEPMKVWLLKQSIKPLEFKEKFGFK